MANMVRMVRQEYQENLGHLEKQVKLAPWDLQDLLAVMVMQAKTVSLVQLVPRESKALLEREALLVSLDRLAKVHLGCQEHLGSKESKESLVSLS